MPTIESIVNLLTRRKRTPDFFWQLAEKHAKLLYNVALRYAGSRYDAEDLVQETFLIAFKQFGQLRDERKFKSWLFTILRNTYLKNLRQEGRKKQLEYDDGVDYIRVLEDTVEHIDAARIYERKVESNQIQNLLNELPEKHKSPLLLYYMTEMSYQEMAQTLDLPVGTVMSRLSRVKQILKKKVLRLHMRASHASNVIQFPRQKFRK
jgi:RNA polymerase sigma-70 factor (ECF subfamily)